MPQSLALRIHIYAKPAQLRSLRSLPDHRDIADHLPGKFGDPHLIALQIIIEFSHPAQHLLLIKTIKVILPLVQFILEGTNLARISRLIRSQ